MPPKGSIFRGPNAQHFQLVHRSQQDPLINDPEASQRVLKPMGRGNDSRKVGIAYGLMLCIMANCCHGRPKSLLPNSKRLLINPKFEPTKVKRHSTVSHTTTLRTIICSISSLLVALAVPLKVS